MTTIARRVEMNPGLGIASKWLLGTRFGYIVPRNASASVHVTNSICMLMERTLGFQHSCLPMFSHS